MLIVSSDMGSRPLCVNLTARSAVFICGETEVMVPWRIVPRGTRMSHATIDGAASMEIIPFFNSIVTVSFAHFIKNLRIVH